MVEKWLLHILYWHWQHKIEADIVYRFIVV